MKIFKFLFVTFLLLSENGVSQIPTDFLPSEFHKTRRAILRAKMPKNSVAVVFSNPIRNRANDVNYVFHQDPNFYYLTGYRAPNAVLVLFSENYTDTKGVTYNEILYVQKRDVNAEMWNGKRLGSAGVISELGFVVAANTEDFINASINFKSFDAVFVTKFKDDYGNSSGNKTALYDLVAHFKNVSGFYEIEFLSEDVTDVHQMIANVPDIHLMELSRKINQDFPNFPALKEDPFILDFANAKSANVLKDFKQKMILKLNSKKNNNLNFSFLPSNLTTMREVKTPEELKLLKKAIRISAIGQIEVMKAMQPHVSETELQGIHEFVYKKYGAEYEGYPSIVGAGNNGCILHYIENNKTKVGDDLVLMDLGAEYRGFTADVTRTIPANGKFTNSQKEIYNLVYKAQEAGIALYTIGTNMRAPNEAAIKIINDGLFELGILSSVNEKHTYFPHGTSHHIGLDVHDPGNYNNFEENMIVTMEPGIYIPEGSNCDEKYWGIAIRIEDDILVTKNGPVNLSAEAPRTIKEIEKMMAKKSVLDDFVLPDLDK